jgi:hypothetical protein
MLHYGEVKFEIWSFKLLFSVKKGPIIQNT